LCEKPWKNTDFIHNLSGNLQYKPIQIWKFFQFLYISSTCFVAAKFRYFQLILWWHYYLLKNNTTFEQSSGIFHYLATSVDSCKNVLIILKVVLVVLTSFFFKYDFFPATFLMLRTLFHDTLNVECQRTNFRQYNNFVLNIVLQHSKYPITFRCCRA